MAGSQNSLYITYVARPGNFDVISIPFHKMQGQSGAFNHSSIIRKAIPVTLQIGLFDNFGAKNLWRLYHPELIKIGRASCRERV